jgi:hypothetical protein
VCSDRVNRSLDGAFVEATLYFGEQARERATAAKCTLGGEPVKYLSNCNGPDPILWRSNQVSLRLLELVSVLKQAVVFVQRLNATILLLSNKKKFYLLYS